MPVANRFAALADTTDYQLIPPHLPASLPTPLPTPPLQTLPSDESPEGPSCRLCYGTLDDGLMLSPCACKGSLEFIHESCLNEMRLKGTDPSFFSVSGCTLCLTKYRVVDTTSRPGAILWALGPRGHVQVKLTVYVVTQLSKLLLLSALCGLIPLHLAKTIPAAFWALEYNYHYYMDNATITGILDASAGA